MSLLSDLGRNLVNLQNNEIRYFQAAVSLCVGSLQAKGVYDSLSPNQSAVALAYNLVFDYNFNNKEFHGNKYSRSMTINNFRLNPSIGLSIGGGDRFSHRIMVGADLRKDAGDGTKVRAETSFWSNLNAKVGNERFMRCGGISRSYLERGIRRRSSPIRSEVYESVLEGMMLKYRTLLCWRVASTGRGQSEERRERFMLTAFAKVRLSNLFSAGVAGQFYHYACSFRRRVVDNNLIQPFFRADFSKGTNFQLLSAQAAFLLGLQKDRAADRNFSLPCGGELTLDVRRWNVGIHSTVFYGDDMMPLYGNMDRNGDRYGDNLYYGSLLQSPLGRLRSCCYTRLKAYWRPYQRFSGSFAVCCVSFNDGYRLSAESLSLFNLDKLTHNNHYEKVVLYIFLCLGFCLPAQALKTNLHSSAAHTIDVTQLVRFNLYGAESGLLLWRSILSDSVRRVNGGRECDNVDAGDCLQGDNAAYYYNLCRTLSRRIYIPGIASYMKYEPWCRDHDIEPGTKVYDRVSHS